MLYKKNTHDTQKGLALGIFIGAAATLALSSKKLRSKLNSSVPAEQKEQIKALKAGADKKAADAKLKATQTVSDVKDKVSDKNKA